MLRDGDVLSNVCLGAQVAIASVHPSKGSVLGAEEASSDYVCSALVVGFVLQMISLQRYGLRDPGEVLLQPCMLLGCCIKLDSEY